MSLLSISPGAGSAYVVTQALRVRDLMLVAVASVGLLTVSSVAKANAGDEECRTKECFADAAEADAGYVSNDELPRFAEDLARAGRFRAAQEAVSHIRTLNPRDSLGRTTAELAIAICEFAQASWARPRDVASYRALDLLAKGSDQDVGAANAGNYWLLADQIINLGPFRTSQSPSLTTFLRMKTLRRGENASLTDLLQARWPHVIEALPLHKQGWHWGEVAQVWLAMGNRGAAVEATERAERTGAYDFQSTNQVFSSTTYLWLELGDFDRALAAARRDGSPSGQATLQIAVAQAMLRADKRREASEVLKAAAAAAAAEPFTGDRMLHFRTIVDGLHDAGHSQEAGDLANEMMLLAHQPDLFPASQLAIAAAAYNDVGDHERAARALHEALGRLPDSKTVIAFGSVASPVTGATLGVGDSIRSEITRELYRAGEREEFARQLAALSAEDQARTWMELYSETRQSREALPTAREVMDALPPDEQMALANEEALEALTSSEPAQAKTLLQRVLDSESARMSSQPRQLLVAAQIARAAGFTKLSAQVLTEAGRASSRISDRGTRASELAGVSALAHELIDP